jgi:hypothetical protein
MPGDIAYDRDAMPPSVSLTTKTNGHLKNLLNGVAANTHFIGVKHTQTYSCIHRFSLDYCLYKNKLNMFFWAFFMQD